MGKLSGLSVLIGFVSLVLGIAGLIVPLWYATDVDQGSAEVQVKRKIYRGLWHDCWKTEYVVNDDYQCQVIVGTHLDTDGLKAAQATTVIGLACLVVMFLLLIIYIQFLNKKTWVAKVIGGLAFVAGVFQLIAPIVYATDVRSDYRFDVLELHTSFGLIIVSAVLTLICGILACVM